ncbi:MAG: hypothetical protein Q7T50_02715 [Candidatus Magasanikbacteria bacterium]|nr:hypothetical protein [Candidatus Magasanikbacteria bacterium]
MNKPRIILHIDMNSYFASVEQQANPFLRGRSVGVCAYLSPNGVILASSREAKEKGIKTGFKVREAQFIDPKIVLLENEPAKYRAVTKKFFKILEDYTDQVEPYSIDEAFVDLTGWVEDFAGAEKIATEIRNRIKTEVGEWLECSIGISWTKFLAKFTGDIAPKKSTLIIRDQNELDLILKNRNLKDAWGINKRTELKLNTLGIFSLLDLKNYDAQKIKQKLGLYGYYLWCHVNGQEISHVSVGNETPKSIGHSYCIPQKSKDKEYLKVVLYKLCEKTGRRLRSLGLEAQRINLNLAFIEVGGINKSLKIQDRMYTSEEIFKQAEMILDNLNLIFPIRTVAVSVSALSPLTSQLSFFENKTEIKNLSLALDKINNKYGEFAIVRGQMFGAKDMAKDRIGFRKVS